MSDARALLTELVRAKKWRDCASATMQADDLGEFERAVRAVSTPDRDGGMKG